MKIVNFKLKIAARRGFTLIELLISVTILVMVLAAAVQVEVSSIKLASHNAGYLQATNLAQEQLNLLRTVRDNNIKADPTKPFNGWPNAVGIAKQLKLNVADKTYSLENASPATGKVYTIDGKQYKVQIKIQDAPPLP